MTGAGAPRPVLLGQRETAALGPPGAAAALAQVAAGAAAAAGDVGAALAQSVAIGGLAPPPGGGRTRLRWDLLATAAAADLGVARTAEAHLDALAILAEAGHAPPPPGSSWGVFAAEGPGLRVDARPTGDRAGGWTLTGTKPWCSLAASLTHALVTASTGDDRRLFALDLRQPGVHPHPPSGWASRGLTTVPSVPVDLDDAAARPVGADGWYLRRDGFAWGGLGVAACWYGGAVGLARRLRASVVDPPGGRPPDQVAHAHLGGVDVALAGARAALAAAAAHVDARRASGGAGAVLAHRVRSVVAAAAEEVLTRVGHALGPAPLAHEEEHARRVADLTVYLRQHHAERDLAALGAALVRSTSSGAATTAVAW